MEKKYYTPFQGPLSEFPTDTNIPEGVKVVHFTDKHTLGFRFLPNVVYEKRDGKELHLQILYPDDHMNNDRTYPMVIYVQGSAWMEQGIYQSLDKMIDICRRGYVVAIVEYRHTGIAPFPAQAEDAKTAIRFMKKHSAEYHGNPDKVAIWGDSSGGHTALMAGFTAGRYPDNGSYGEISSEVQAIVDWYGPTDIAAMNEFPSVGAHRDPMSPEGRLIGFKDVLDNPEEALKTSPMQYLSAEIPTPPLFIMHGNRDHLVPFNQSCLLLAKMQEMGKDVEMVCLEGAFHGFAGFGSDEALDLVAEFLKKTIG